MYVRRFPGDGEARFESYIESLAQVVRHADRVAHLRAYCLGLMLPGARKSVEPMAARLHPDRTGPAHQSMHHFVAKADWSDEMLLAAVRARALPILERHAPIGAWVVDEACTPRRGPLCVGVTRQPCGNGGPPRTCQVAVTLSIANERACLPVAHRLHLPEDWAGDVSRRRAAGVPAEVGYRTRTRIALDQIAAAHRDGIAPGVVVAESGYGSDADFRDAISGLGLDYVVAIEPSTRPHGGATAAEMIANLPAESWREPAGPEAEADRPPVRRAAVRLLPSRSRFAYRDAWLIADRPSDQAAPGAYWISTLPYRTSDCQVDRAIALGWRSRRDLHDLDRRFGLGHYRGRGWRGFHHHAALCIAAYGFLIAERLGEAADRADSAFRLTAYAGRR